MTFRSPVRGSWGRYATGTERRTEPASWESLPGEHPGEGGLAGAVAPDEADPVPGRDLEGHRLEELATSGGELDVGGGDHEGQS